MPLFVPLSHTHTTVALPQRQMKTEIDADVGRRKRRRTKTEVDEDEDRHTLGWSEVAALPQQLLNSLSHLINSLIKITTLNKSRMRRISFLTATRVFVVVFVSVMAFERELTPLFVDSLRCPY